MKNEKFKILQFIREFILMQDKEMENFAKKDIELKNRIKMNTYDILELAYEANAAMDLKLKQHLVIKIITKVKLIDFLLNIAYDKNLITEKKYYKLGLRLGDIAKYSNGWLKNIS